MEFEKVLRERLYNREVENIQRNFVTNYERPIESSTLKDTHFASITNAYSIYMEYKKRNLSQEQLYKLCDEFEQAISAEALNEMKKSIHLEEREKAYIKYKQLLDGFISGEIAIAEVLARRVLLQKLQEEGALNEETIENALEILKKQVHEYPRFESQYKYVEELLKGSIYDNIEQDLEAKIAQNVEYDFNHQINCGGYALKIDICIFPSDSDFEKRVSGILEAFPFVRLLGETKLKEDEYLVLYRARGGGHHFIRIEDDGSVLEKNGAEEPRRFQDWGTLQNAPEAVFAVKKEHEMNYNKENGSIVIPTANSKNFEETVVQAIQNKTNSFEYHNHSYTLKRAGAETVYICSNKEIIAEMLTDGNEYDIEIRAGKQGYVSNNEPKIPVVIKEGMCQNATSLIRGETEEEIEL